jgi:hypothetical protein
VSSLKLELLFDNRELRLYDISNLVLKPPFDRLLNFDLFKQVQVDEQGRSTIPPSDNSPFRSTKSISARV